MLQVNVIIGLEASGKTSFVKRYAKEEDHVIDNIMIYGDMDYYIKRSIETGKPVLWLVVGNYPDELWLRRSFDSWMNLFKQEYGVKINVISIDERFGNGN